jgi:predicted GH43/DUF377 family glycosyl hydrolase/RimJ/RimL family protein N-acetyltransferase
MPQPPPPLTLRPATLADAPLLRRWDEQPHVIACDPNDDWQWEAALAAPAAWREPLVAELAGRPVGFLEIIDPAGDPERYWGEVPAGLRAIDIWIGEPDALGRGHGTEMMRQALAKCFAAPEVEAVLVDPLADNVRAHRFYTRLGFRLVEHRRFGLDDCHVMRLDRAAWRESTDAAHALALFRRHPANPIVTPIGHGWRGAVTFNPGVIRHAGRFYLFERCAGGLRPFHCSIGLRTSEDGVVFTPVGDEPLIRPADLGSEYGSVQDPRVVELEGRFYLTVAYRPFAWASHPTGVGVPESHQVAYPGFSGRDEDNQTRSALFVSEDLLHWRFHGWLTPEGIDDRNVILFPERVTGRYWVTRRPSPLVGTQANHAAPPKGVMLAHSTDLRAWSEPVEVLRPAFAWEDNRLGGSTPPIRTEAGWLLFYHGVQNVHPATRRVCYRMGAALLALDDPTRVLARCPFPLLEPREYYERFGLYIPDVVFPTAAPVVDGVIHLYYGVCDTAIALATAPLDEVVAFVRRFPAC